MILPRWCVCGVYGHIHSSGIWVGGPIRPYISYLPVTSLLTGHCSPPQPSAAPAGGSTCGTRTQQRNWPLWCKFKEFPLLVSKSQSYKLGIYYIIYFNHHCLHPMHWLKIWPGLLLQTIFVYCLYLIWGNMNLKNSCFHSDYFEDYGQNQISAIQFSTSGLHLAIVTDDRWEFLVWAKSVN